MLLLLLLWLHALILDRLFLCGVSRYFGSVTRCRTIRHHASTQRHNECDNKKHDSVSWMYGRLRPAGSTLEAVMNLLPVKRP